MYTKRLLLGISLGRWLVWLIIKIRICTQTKMKIHGKTYVSRDGRYLFAVNGSLVIVTTTPKVQPGLLQNVC